MGIRWGGEEIMNYKLWMLDFEWEILEGGEIATLREDLGWNLSFKPDRMKRIKANYGDDSA